MNRRSFLASAGLLSAASVLPMGAANAQSPWPSRPVTMFVPFGAGGPTDVAARLIGQHLETRTRQRFQVENRVQQGVVGGTDAVAKAQKDGHTLLFTTVGHASVRALYNRIPFDLERDFEPVSLIGVVPMVVIVGRSSPHQDLRSLVAHLRANPGKYDYGSSGIGGAIHLASELFKRAFSVDLGHVPYRSSAATHADLEANRVVMVFDTLAGAMPAITAGRARALAITGAQRSPTIPNVPTFAELGTDVNAATWNAVLAPGGTPGAIVQSISEAINAVLAIEDVSNRLRGLGVDVVNDSTPQSTSRFVAAQIAQWESVIRAANIRAE